MSDTLAAVGLTILAISEPQIGGQLREGFRAGRNASTAKGGLLTGCSGYDPPLEIKNERPTSRARSGPGTKVNK